MPICNVMTAYSPALGVLLPVAPCDSLMYHNYGFLFTSPAKFTKMLVTRPPIFFIEHNFCQLPYSGYIAGYCRMVEIFVSVVTK